jgi:signal transduction histidine kinase
LGQLRAAVSQAVREVRQAIASLRRDAPLPQSLQEELQTLVARYQRKSAASIAFRPHIPAPVQLPEEHLQQVRRVAEEALRNAVRHSGAQHIAVELAADGRKYHLIVRDDGRGFVPEDVPYNHFGLQIMRARAARLKGSLMVESAPEKGTRVTLAWPSEPQQQPAVLETL